MTRAGYGADPTSALIRWNRFEAMRHAVAGQGYPGEDYEARDNLMGDAAPDGTPAPNAYSQSAGDCGTLHWCLADGATGALRGEHRADLLTGGCS